ncbi:probable malonyl-CoA-acyl carrier protein transacylase, mitochondrial [Zerene cesonia]|uniref:probable malonyl-CoA-acyl carrier protein transacylase, mitochondrial n=1 Tax=Zerene cesonia TaxID=33412 RepID=UPI0018E51C29|nr:probable malonyl-CoA-acyl carrier protein transacylase, mitochondrial [Zerene cesonia]
MLSSIRLLRRTCACLRLQKRSIKQNSNSDSPLRRLLRDASAFGEADPTKAPEGELLWATQPYATGVKEPPPHQVDPTETTVLLFPGQGSQYVGMGKCLDNVPSAKELYELASSVVGWDVARVCREGPEEELQRRCQTAVLVTSLGALELARETRPGAIERVRAVAGFSLGEITAMVYVGALQLEQALRLVEVRAAAMEAAARERAGGMLTVWLAPDARLGALLHAARDHAARPDAVCQVANYLYPGCKVLAGDEEALRYVEREGRRLGVRRSARVRVAGAFHTPLMARAEAAVREALRACDVAAPRVPLVSGVDARAVLSAPAARRRLARLTAAPVRWEQVLHALYARPRPTPQPLTLALGPGAALRATLKLVNARAWDASLHVDV